MDKIFEEFRQGTSGRRKGRAGSGLGLAISRQLLNLMGGKIWAESTPGRGSTFSFTLPVYAPEPVQQQG
jgi:signal transduction histidine kinase